MAVVTNRKRNEDGQRVEWLKIQWLQVSKSNPFKLYYKYTINDDADFMCINIAKRGRTINLSEIILSPLYLQPRDLSHEKFVDLQKLMKYVLPIHHAFYKTLTYTAAAKGKG